MNIVDSMIVTLGLDPKDFEKGQKQAVSNMVAFRKEADQQTKKIDESMRRMGDGFSKVRNEALSLFAVLMGAKGFKEFIGNTTDANTQLGLFARNIGETPQMLQAWGAALERIGGKQENASASLGGIAKAFFDLKQNGKALPEGIYRVFAMAGKTVDPSKGLDNFLNDLAESLQKLSKEDPTAAYFFGKGMGLTDDMVNLMIKYGRGTADYVKSLQELSASDKAIKAAQDLTESFATLRQEFRSVGNELYETLGPAITDLIDEFSRWIAANKEWIASGITEAIKDFIGYVKSIDWDAVGQGIKNFAEGAKEASDAVGGLANASKIIAGIWVASKVLKMATAMTTLGGSATVLATKLGPVAAALGSIAAIIGMSGEGGKSINNWINENVPGAAALDTFVYHATGGLLGTSEAAQQWYRENPGQQFTGDVDDFNKNPEKYLIGPDPTPKTVTRGENRKRQKERIAGHRATGGNVQAGESYVINERGREVFTPGVSGTITPNSALGGLKVNGREVSRGNPLPVALQDINSTSGKGFLEMLFGNAPDIMKDIVSGTGSVIGAALGIDNGGSGRGSGAASSSNYGKGKSVKGWWTPERMSHAVDRLMAEAGLSKEGAAGLVARWAGVEASGGPSEINPNGGAFGIAQWLGPRKAGIAGNTDFDDQLSYAVKELNTTEKRAGDVLRAAKTAAEGARGASMYERAEGYNARTGTDLFTGKTPVNSVLEAIEKHKSNPLSPTALNTIGVPSGAALSVMANRNVTSSTSSQSLHIESLNINAPAATNATEIAQGIGAALQDYAFIAMSNTGQA